MTSPIETGGAGAVPSERIESLIRVYEHRDANGPALASALRELLDRRAPAAEAGAIDDGWRPIETAPRDGTKVMLWNGDGRCFDKWVKGSWELERVFGDLHDGDEPRKYTHWRPLPPPPQVEA